MESDAKPTDLLDVMNAAVSICYSNLDYKGLKGYNKIEYFECSLFAEAQSQAMHIVICAGLS